MTTSHVDASKASSRAPAGKRKRPPNSVPRIYIFGYKYAVLVVWAILIVVFCALEPTTFMTVQNLQTLLSSQGTAVILALSLLATLTVGEFDVSVAGNAGLSATVVAVLNGVYDVNLSLAVILGVLSGCLIGLINGLIVVGLNVNSFVATLGMGTLLQGVASLISDNSTVGGVSGWLSTATNHKFFGIAGVFYFALLLAAILWYVLRHTPLGRYALFVGRNPEVSRLVGIRVDAVRYGAFILGGLMASLAGISIVGVAGGFDPSQASGLLLPAFAAAFLGAAVITPGRFNAWGIVIAVYFVATGISGFQFAGISGWVLDVFYGGILVLAVALSTVVGRKLNGAQNTMDDFLTSEDDTRPPPGPSAVGLGQGDA